MDLGWQSEMTQQVSAEVSAARCDSQVKELADFMSGV